MEDLNKIISKNLKKIRTSRKLSLESLSKLSGVSKSMLGQIERGEVNPTITTLWKISNGLKISFTELMDREESNIEIRYKKDMTPLFEDNGNFKNYPVFSYDSKRKFEMYMIEMNENSVLTASPHPEGVEEFLTVFSGELTLTIENEKFVLGEGDSISFKADKVHNYFNSSNLELKMSLVIYYSS